MIRPCFVDLSNGCALQALRSQCTMAGNVNRIGNTSESHTETTRISGESSVELVHNESLDVKHTRISSECAYNNCYTDTNVQENSGSRRYPTRSMMAKNVSRNRVLYALGHTDTLCRYVCRRCEGFYETEVELRQHFVTHLDNTDVSNKNLANAHCGILAEVIDEHDYELGGEEPDDDLPIRSVEIPDRRPSDIATCPMSSTLTTPLLCHLCEESCENEQSMYQHYDIHRTLINQSNVTSTTFPNTDNNSRSENNQTFAATENVIIEQMCSTNARLSTVASQLGVGNHVHKDITSRIVQGLSDKDPSCLTANYTDIAVTQHSSGDAHEKGSYISNTEGHAATSEEAQNVLIPLPENGIQQHETSRCIPDEDDDTTTTEMQDMSVETQSPNINSNVETESCLTAGNIIGCSTGREERTHSIQSDNDDVSVTTDNHEPFPDVNSAVDAEDKPSDRTDIMTSLHSCPSNHKDSSKLNHEKKKIFEQLKENRAIYCRPCKLNFPKRSKYITHMITHIGTCSSVQFCCLVCHETSTNPFSMRDHIITSHTGSVAPSSEGKPLKELPPGVQKLVSSTVTQISAESATGMNSLNTTPIRCYRAGDCLVCKRFCKSRKTLMTHMMKKHSITGGDSPFACNICQQSFEEISLCESHLLTQHTNVYRPNKRAEDTVGKTYECVCSNRFAKESYLIKHLIFHSVFKPFKCAHCDHRTHSKADLDGHMFVHNRMLELPFKCKHCDQRCRNAAGLRKHERLHGDGEKRFCCDKCGKCFVSSQALLFHGDVHGAVKEYKCKDCQELFTRPCFLIEHAKIVHSNSKPFTCTQCEKRFPTEAILKIHEISHTGKFHHICAFCSKTLRTKEGLQKHEMQHTGLKPFSCKYCVKGFATRENVDRHEMIHLGLRPFKCKLCDKAFNQPSSLKRHELLHSGDKPYVCNECGKTFRQTGGLLMHMSTHTGRKLFMCKLCGEQFNIVSSYRQHIRRHTGENPHQCQDCDESFARAVELKSHRFDVHGIGRKCQCEHCGMRFIIPSALRRHIELRHSSENPYCCMICDQRFLDIDGLKLHMTSAHL